MGSSSSKKQDLRKSETLPNNKVIINNNFIIVNDKNNDLRSSFQTKLDINKKIEKIIDYKGNKIYSEDNNDINEKIKEDENITIIIKSQIKDIHIQVKLDDIIKDIIIRYKSKLQNDKINVLAFRNESGKILFPNHKLRDIGIKDMSIIYADLEFEEEENKDQDSKINDNLEYEEISKSDLEDLKLKMKKKLKEGLITIQIHNNKLGTQFFFVNPKVKFKVVAEQFNKKNPGKNWYYLYNGKIVDLDDTLSKLKIKMLSKILVEELL